MRFEPVSLPFPAATNSQPGTLWTPLRIVIKVANRTNAGTDFAIETVRLVNMAAP
jgi:hypothetical protein